MTEPLRTSGWAPTLAWIHAAVFLAVAAGCYLAPQALFGDAAWLQMPRLAVGLVAAALVALAVVLLGAVRSRDPRTLRLALLGALVLDAQVPVLLSLHPVVFEFLGRDVGLPWFAVSLAVIV